MAAACETAVVSLFMVATEAAITTILAMISTTTARVMSKEALTLLSVDAETEPLPKPLTASVSQIFAVSVSAVGRIRTISAPAAMPPSTWAMM